VNKEEEDAPCAAREARLCVLWYPAASSLRIVVQVYEETGFDISGLIVERDFIEITSNQQRTKLYIVADVDEQVSGLWRSVASAR
jgi:hypothetical protein